MKDLAGKSYGLWLVLSEGPRDKANKRQWLCRCECGLEKLVNQGNLTSGKSKNCVNCKEHYVKHGLAEKHRLYSTWKSMRSRCNNPNVSAYKYYGGKGIRVCTEWGDFQVFVDDMYPSFVEGLTLDRIDGNLGYSKENCKWSTIPEQNENQSTAVLVEYQGSFVNESVLAKLTGVPRTTIQARRLRGATTEEMIHGFGSIQKAEQT